MKLTKEKYKAIVPPQELEGIVTNGIEKGIKQSTRIRKLKYKRPMWGLVAAVVAFVILLNTSVVFATAVRDVPIIRDFANMVLINPGIKYALKEGYIQKVNKSWEIDGVNVTITRIIGDNKKLIFGYTIDGIEEKEGQYIGPRTIKFQDEEGRELEMLLSYGIGDYSNDGLKPLENEKYFEVDLKGKGSVPEKITVIFDQIENKNNSERNEVLSTSKFTMNIEIKDKMLEVEPQTYVLNKEVHLNEYKIFIKEMRVYPMGTELVIKRDLGKEQRFTWIDNGYLEDEKGNVYRLYQGSSSEDGSEYTLTFGGGAYNKAKELTLKANGVFYQPKVDKQLVIDRNHEKLLEDGGYGIELLGVDYRDGKTQFNFKIKEDAKISSINLNFLGSSKQFEQHWNEYGNGEYISNFGVAIDTLSAQEDILKFTVPSIHKYKTESFDIKLK